MNALSPTTDVWRTPRRVFDNSGRFTMQTPLERYGDFNPAGYGDYGRVQRLAAEVRTLDYADWVDIGMRQLQHLFRAPDLNAAFFEALKPFEMRLEDALRVSLGGVAIYSKPVAPFIQASMSGRPPVPPETVKWLISRSVIDGALFHVDMETGDVYYGNPARYKLDPTERELLQNDLGVTRNIILTGYRLQHPTKLVGMQRLEPHYPALEEPWVPPAVEEMTVEAEQPGEAQIQEEISAPPEPTKRARARTPAVEETVAE